MLTTSFEELKNYNNNTDAEQQIQISFLEKTKNVIKSHNLCWLEKPFDTFLTSISETARIYTSKPSSEKKRFCDYATDACQNFFNYLCSILCLCDNGSSSIPTLFDEGERFKWLLELYTNYSNDVAHNISQFIGDELDKKHIDSFFATLDINKDIYVDPITEYRDENGDHNLSVIHIPFSKVSSYSEVFRTIAHEIGHHVGQTGKLRKLRSQLYIKCMLYHILYKYAIIKKPLFEKASIVSESFENLITILYNDAEEYLNSKTDFNFANIESLSHEPANVIYNNVVWSYYTATTFEAINTYFNKLLKDNQKLQALYNRIVTNLGEEDIDKLLEVFKTNDICTYHDVFGDMFSFNHPNDDPHFIMETKQNCILSSITRALRQYVDRDDDDLDSPCVTEDNISDLFRECYADMVMLRISGYGEKTELCDIYFNKMLDTNNKALKNASGSDKLRFYTIFHFICNQDIPIEIKNQQYFKAIEEEKTKLHDDDEYYVSCVLKYLSLADEELKHGIENCPYLKSLKELFKQFDDLKDVENSNSILKSMHTLNFCNV